MWPGKWRSFLVPSTSPPFPLPQSCAVLLPCTGCSVLVFSLTLQEFVNYQLRGGGPPVSCGVVEGVDEGGLEAGKVRVNLSHGCIIITTNTFTLAAATRALWPCGNTLKYPRLSECEMNTGRKIRVIWTHR